jgi:hypothetical protein
VALQEARWAGNRTATRSAGNADGDSTGSLVEVGGGVGEVPTTARGGVAREFRREHGADELDLGRRGGHPRARVGDEARVGAHHGGVSGGDDGGVRGGGGMGGGAPPGRRGEDERAAAAAAAAAAAQGRTPRP